VDQLVPIVNVAIATMCRDGADGTNLLYSRTVHAAIGYARNEYGERAANFIEQLFFDIGCGRLQIQLVPKPVDPKEGQ
jgi:hypothetical protein